MNCNRYILNELNKGIKMGMDSISSIAEKVTDDQLKDDLQSEYNQYNTILNDVNAELGKYEEFPKELNPAQKMMGWFDIQISTMTDDSDSKIAEMLIKGTNMGIIEGVKLLNNNPETTPEIKNILTNFIQFQENNVERLKKYL